MKIENQLLADCIQKKRLAQHQLYKEVFSYLMNICIRYKSDYDAAGASLNTIFLKILDNLETFNSEDSFIPWIKRIAINQLIDEYRRDKKDKETINFQEEFEPSISPQSFHQKEAEMDAQYLLDMIQQLPNMTAKVFNLYAIDGYKHKEIAELLDMSESTSKWHLADARKKLKCSLEIYNKTA